MIYLNQESWWLRGMGWLEIIWFVLIGLALLVFIAFVITAIVDANQHKDAIRHNYPFLGRFRYWFMHLGVFFRAYFFTEDREELPFNRADREWVYKASRGEELTAAFGSTRSIREPGTFLFLSSTFPPLSRDDCKTSEIVFGEHCPNPYVTDKFFHVSAMSFGAISTPAVLALSSGAKMAGILMDTGEGGISPYHIEGGADLVAEIGTAKYGFRTDDGKLDDAKLRAAAELETVKMFSLKLGQGAKPGEGGILPAKKVNKEIAQIRGIPIHTESISPPRWPEISNEHELLDMIAHVRSITKKPVGFKFVMGDGSFVERLCQEIRRRGVDSAPDFIIVDSCDGGTGAAPATLIDYVGMPIRETLPELVDYLIAYDLRSRIRVAASGKLINPAYVAAGLAIGADYINSARGFMFSLGCIQAMRCNKNTCPTGITTDRRHLQAGLDPQLKKSRVANYAANIHEQVQLITRACGLTDPRQLTREHIRVVREHFKTVPLERVWPYPEVGARLQTDAN